MRGRCLEFDENRYMRSAPGCTSRTILKYAATPATSAAARGGVRASVVRGDISRAADFAPGEYDAVFFTEVLEHVRRPDAAAATLARIVAPCGVVLLSTPFVYRKHPDPVDFYRFTPQAVAAIFEEAGFTTALVESRGDLSAIVAAAAGYHASDLDAAHMTVKNSALAPAVVGVFQQKC